MTATGSSASDLVGKASSFMSGLTQYLEKGVGAWTDEKERERRQREAESSPIGGSHVKKKQKDDAESARVDLEANVKNLAGGLVMTMMQSGGTFLEEQQRVVVARVEKCEQGIDDGNVRISQIENRQEQIDKAFDSMVKDVQDLRLENQKLKEELHVQAAWRPTASAVPTSSPVGASSVPHAAPRPFEFPKSELDLIPRSERLQARCGNLGWDCNSDTLIQRLRTVFEKHGIPPDSWKDPKTDGAKGSAVNVTFNSVFERRMAESKVNGAKEHFSECKADAFVWLRPKKSDCELFTDRIVRELHRVILDFEGRVKPSETDTANWQVVGGVVTAEWKLVDKDDKRRIQHLVSVAGSEVRWTHFAVERYSAFEDIGVVSRWALDRARRRS